MDSLPLRFNYEFSRVLKRGKFASGQFLTVHSFRRPKGIKHNMTLIPSEVIRVGFCANKRQLGAVGRNRARRLMREAYREYEPSICRGQDIVITLRANGELPRFDDIKSELRVLLLRLKAMEMLND